MTERITTEAFPPGEYIQDELEARGWTQQDLAHILNRPTNAINQIIQGKRSITPETAIGLASAFGTSAEVWLNLENAYQLSQVKTQDNEVAKRSSLYSVAPVNEMIRRGWIEAGSTSTIELQLKKFFGTDDLDKIPPLSMAARKSTSYEETTVPQRAWGFRAIQLARNIQVSVFDNRKFKNEIHLLRGATEYPENIRKLPNLIANWGIRLVFISRLETTKIDGATFWIDKDSPVVAMTLRYDRIDAFWFTLIHELIHVKNGDSSMDSELVSDAKGQGGAASVDEIERVANAEAATVLVPQDKLDGFIMRKRPFYSRDSVIRFAQANGVHPGIVVGQLHYRKEIPLKNLRDLLVPVRNIALGTTITDGWSHQPGTL